MVEKWQSAGPKTYRPVITSTNPTTAAFSLYFLSETKWFYRENIALRKLLQITKIEDVIFLSGKKTLQHRSGMLKILKDQGVMIHVIPSQWKAIVLWQKQKKDTRNAEALQH
jgi:16S rRNA G1207 methylase RsmC